MNQKNKNINLSDFEAYLIKNGYSKNVIPRYIRKVMEYLGCINTYSVLLQDSKKLQETIVEYLAKIPYCLQTGTIQAALHSYYYFISGKQFAKRLSAKDFDREMSIEAEIERFRDYLSRVVRLRKNTIISQCNTIRFFLYSNFQKNNFAPERITANQIRDYFSNTLSHVSPASKKTIIVRIRSYLSLFSLLTPL